nr:ester cyclase [Paenibacillus doosanensis]
MLFSWLNGGGDGIGRIARITFANRQKGDVEAMSSIEQKNTETAAALIGELIRKGVLERTDQFFSGQLCEAFTERSYDIEETLAQGDKVVARVVITAAHSGMFAGAAPTGRRVKITQFHEFRIVSGNIEEHRGWFDTGTLLPQLQAK